MIFLILGPQGQQANSEQKIGRVIVGVLIHISATCLYFYSKLTNES